jgi:hypothetical protein
MTNMNLNDRQRCAIFVKLADLRRQKARTLVSGLPGLA